ncbi:MAG: hypothetical protein JWR83_3176, partial [Aeromicrobium sp.]|nr:hypothetical protein [Aeromicrobium sp.]
PLIVGAVLALGLLAGCGGSSSGASAHPGSTGLPSSTAGVGKDGSVDAKVCAAIANDVAAITKNVSSPATFPGQCAFGSGATTVSFNVNDPNHTSVTDVISTGAHSISGIGDSAVWYDGIGEITPDLGAWKGSVSCLVSPDSDIQNDMIKYSGTPPMVKIADSDAAGYAQKLGAICNDVFSATG